MKIFNVILRILGILFFSYRAFIAYGKIDFSSEDPSLYSFTFFIWLMIILIIIFLWIFSSPDEIQNNHPVKRVVNKEKEDLEKIRKEYDHFVSKT